MKDTLLEKLLNKMYIKKTKENFVTICQISFVKFSNKNVKQKQQSES